MKCHRLPSPPPARRRPARSGLWLFALALVFQLLMPFAQVVAAAPQAGGADHVVMCTPAGLVTYRVEADGSLSERPDTSPQAAPCEFCHGCKSAAALPVGLSGADSFAHRQRPVSMRPLGHQTDRPGRQFIEPQAPTRGPPLFPGFRQL